MGEVNEVAADDAIAQWRIAPSVAAAYVDPEDVTKRELTMLTLSGELTTLSFDESSPTLDWSLHAMPPGVTLAAPPTLLVQKPGATKSYWSVSTDGNAMQRINTHKVGKTWQWIEHGRPGLARGADGVVEFKDGKEVQNADVGKLAFARPGAWCRALSFRCRAPALRLLARDTSLSLRCCAMRGAPPPLLPFPHTHDFTAAIHALRRRCSLCLLCFLFPFSFFLFPFSFFPPSSFFLSRYE